MPARSIKVGDRQVGLKSIRDRVGRRWAAVTLYLQGRSITQVSRELGVSREFVRSWVDRFSECGHVSDKTGGRGAPECLDKDGLLRASILLENTGAKRAAAQLQREGHVLRGAKLDERTLRRISSRHGLNKYLMNHYDLLSLKNMQDRLDYCNEHRHTRWGDVMFSDSTHITSAAIPKGTWVRLKRGKFPRKRIRVEGARKGTQASQKSHVFAVMSKYGASQLIFASGTKYFKRYKSEPSEEHPKGEWLNAVRAEEYSHILKKMKTEMVRIHKNAGHRLGRFQQDRATPHDKAMRLGVVARF